MIKPIETVYKGYRFRSRLEARWAVFFDALGLEWEYEKEGYKIILPYWTSFANGKNKEIYYLPDFWLPELNVFIEIKPNNVYNREIYQTFGYDVHPIIVFDKSGLDVEPSGCFYAGDYCDSGGGFYNNYAYLNWCFNCQFYYIYIEDDRLTRDRVLHGGDYVRWENRCKCEEKFAVYNNHMTERAIVKFKQARFEHGENGE